MKPTRRSRSLLHSAFLPALGAVLAGLVLAQAEAGPAEDSDEDDLFHRGDRLARQGDHGGALEAWNLAYQEKVPRLRDLPFRFPVNAQLLDRKGVRAKMLLIFEKEYPDTRVEADRLGFAAFGFMPIEIDLKETLVSVFSEEVAGFYDPDTKGLYLIREQPAAKKAKEGFFEKLLGGGSSDMDQDKAVLSHELAHALADQHFDLHSLWCSVKDDDDTSFAVTALIEGEAMLVMMADVMAAGDPDALFQAPLEFVVATMEILVPFASGFGKAFQSAPLLIRESLLAPYTKGFRFCIKIAKEEGWETVNMAFRKPPVSSEQVLHPEKYLAATRDDPVALSFAAECPLAGEGWDLVKENVLGEFAIEVLLRPSLGILRSSKAAAGWDGDAYRVYRKKGAGTPLLFLAWASTWDSEEEAREFASGFLEALAPPDTRADLPGRPAGAERSWSTDRGSNAIWRKGADVWFLAAPPGEDLARLAPWSFEIRRQPKSVRLKSFPPTVKFPEAGDSPRRAPSTLDKKDR